MQRNMDLVRMILMEIEKSPSGLAASPFGLLAFSPKEIQYHIHLMMEDGLIEAVDASHPQRNNPEAEPRVALTAKGHDFLDLARDPERWQQARARILKLGSAPIAVWMKVLTDLLLKKLGVAS